ncbi:FAD binding domain-containing protein [Fusarium napiforme]|uniref:FAD binding domain-containing protein n=1 Tax=Fusarium napiforme TaxID=42672 RepID=A0A8H5I9N0_9HYPO|nr:FAD binding domain-containing protein [Fusarium napiforme]
MVQPKPKALIVGAGIAGLSTAWWLDKAGWSCIIIDKAPGIRSGGYVVGLAGICLETVQEMGLLKQLENLSFNADKNTIRDVRGRKLLELGYKDIYDKLGSYSVCRDDLARLIWTALPPSVDVRFSETVNSATEEEDGIVVTLASGDAMNVQLLIGADGIRSVVRSMIWKDQDFQVDLGYSYSVYDAEEIVRLESDCVSFNSPGHFDILYRIRKDRLAALHVWRNDYTKQYGAKFNTRDRLAKFEALRLLAGDNMQVADVLSAAEKSGTTPLVDTLTMVQMPRWSKGRVLLMGDAAHCLTLMSGQGAGMAITSAGILGKEIMASGSLSEALENHERKQRPRVERLQRRSAELAAWYIPKSTFWYWLRNMMLKLMPYSWIIAWFVNGLKEETKLTYEN